MYRNSKCFHSLYSLSSLELYKNSANISNNSFNEFILLAHHMELILAKFTTAKAAIATPSSGYFSYCSLSNRLSHAVN